MVLHVYNHKNVCYSNQEVKPMSIAEHIKNSRKQRHMTQKQLAEKTGLAIITIQQYEAGKYEPKYENLEKLSKALEVPVVDLVNTPGTYERLNANSNPYIEKQISKQTKLFYSMMKVLESIYERSVDIDVTEFYKNGDVYSSNYISVGVGDNKIAIPNGQFDNLLELIKSFLTNIISMIGEDEKNFLSEWESEPEIDYIETEECEFVKLAVLDKNGDRHSPLL